MLKKIIIGIVTTIICSVIGGVEYINLKTDNSVGDENVSNIVQENKIDETFEKEVNELNNEENSNFVAVEDKNENIGSKEKQTDNNKVTEPIKEKSSVTSNKKTNVAKQSTDENKNTKVTKKEEVKDTTDEEKTINNTEEVKKQTEEIIYNSTATNQLINDINELAKENKNLWGANSEKLYKIKISNSLVGKNYISPYNKDRISGIVKNTYPVTFLVYAIDYNKPGFATQTRYYIDITEY